MLSVYFGNDVVAVRTKAFAYITTLEKKSYEVVRIEADAYERGMCAALGGGPSLFSGKKVYVLDTPSDSELFIQELTGLLPEFSKADDMYVVIEGALLSPDKKRYEKVGATLYEHTKTDKDFFNVFALADALARKDKKMLWVGIIEARTHGLSSEEVIGTLWWQLKTLSLAGQTKSAAEAGLKDFPYNKAKRALALFREGEIKRLSQELLAVYHDGHSGVRDIDTAFEAWALTL
jgi:DNA polymerase III delta subunit